LGLFEWARRFFGGRPRRDVTRLPGIDDADAVSETIDVSGGPLKPHHRRRALRDPRLLPKAIRHTVRGKRRRVLARDEADRLFAGTLRTTNRHIRDLAPDVEQIERHGLPVWRTEADVAQALGVSVRELRFFAMHREKEKAPHYVCFAIPKRSGGERLILAPKPRLKALQRRLLDLLVSRLPVSEQAHGFRKARSIRTGAEPHVGRGMLVQMDLKDFFPTVTHPRVRGLLIALGYGYPVAATLAALMTESPRQPVEVDGVVYHVPVGPRHCVQGAPTSPGLCNAVTVKLDHRLRGLATAMGFRYTRYADDLTFSAEAPRDPAGLVSAATQIVQAEGFAVNTAKTRVSRRGRRQVVTGVSVASVLGLSRRERRRLRARIHRLGSDADPAEAARVEGHLAYVRMLNPAQAEALRRSWRGR
jgi:retron-type reverse transcriptase